MLGSGKRMSGMAGVGRARVGLRPAIRLVAGGALSAALLPVLGCGSNFFQCENKPACPASTSSSGSGSSSSDSTVDFAFVSYTTTAGDSVITGYNIASGALTAVNTVTLPFVPIAMAVNPANTILYVASVSGATNPGIYEYSIGTDGTLTAANNGAAVVNDLVGAMTISPDGNYLYTLQSIGLTMTEYQVGSTGTLTSTGVLTVPSLSCAPSVAVPIVPTCSVAVSPKEDFVVASLGTAGDSVFGYTSTTGITNNGELLYDIAPGTNSGDFSGAIDASDNLYLAQTATMTAYELGSSSDTNRGTYTYPTGSAPRSVVVDPSSKFVYTANIGTGKITGFATGTTTALTVLSGSPYAAPTDVAAIGVDSSDTYLVAVGYDASAGLQLYSIAGTDVLTEIKSTGTTTETQDPVLLAMSH